MPTSVNIEGIFTSISKLPSGMIRVSSNGGQFNPCHGLGTGGEFWYVVHPCQRHQYEYWNQMLPTDEQPAPNGVDLSAKPWWSAEAGQRGGLKD